MFQFLYNYVSVLTISAWTVVGLDYPSHKAGWSGFGQTGTLNGEVRFYTVNTDGCSTDSGTAFLT